MAYIHQFNQSILAQECTMQTINDGARTIASVSPETCLSPQTSSGLFAAHTLSQHTAVTLGYGDQVSFVQTRRADLLLWGVDWSFLMLFVAFGVIAFTIYRLWRRKKHEASD